MLLIDYIPGVAGGTKDFKAMMEVGQPEITGIWDSLNAVLNNQFILDLTEYGVKRWERNLKIIPTASEDLYFRKIMILARINEYLPFTMRALRRMLAALCGDDGYSVTLKNDIYHLDVKAVSVTKSIWYDVRAMLNRVVPANLVITVILEHILPEAFVNSVVSTSCAVFKTVIDWELFFESSMMADAFAHIGMGAVTRRTAIDWYLYFMIGMDMPLSAVSGVVGIYRRTVLE